MGGNYGVLYPITGGGINSRFPVRLTAEKRRTRTHAHVRTFEGGKLPVVHGLYFPEIAFTGHPVAHYNFFGYKKRFSWECDWG